MFTGRLPKKEVPTFKLL